MRTLVAGLVLTISTYPVCATENGATSFPNGGEDFLVAAMPPPGFHGIAYLNRYRADRVAGESGDLAIPFDLRVNALALRLDWVKPASILGADRWGALVILPLVDADLSATPIPGVTISGRRRGMGDLTVGNGLHWTLHSFHAVAALDIVAPTGRYGANEAVNIGRNQWVVRFNQMGTWFPSEAIDVSYRAHVDINFRNRDTDYRSGTTAYLNLAIGWKPGPSTTVGVSSFVLKQLADDRQHGALIGPDGHRLASRGIGPAVKHFLPDGMFIAARGYREHGARNGPRGTILWVYGGARF